MPVPMMNIINGGSHSDAPIAFQEFLIRPVGAPSFRGPMRMGTEVFHALKKVLHDRGLKYGRRRWRWFCSGIETVEQKMRLSYFVGHSTGRDMYRKGRDDWNGLCFFWVYKGWSVRLYDFLRSQWSGKRTSDEQVAYLEELINKYPIDSIEDGMRKRLAGMEETDGADWDRCQLVGDDLFVTNGILIERYRAWDVPNSILIKVNQIGSLSETLDVHWNGLIVSGYTVTIVPVKQKMLPLRI